MTFSKTLNLRRQGLTILTTEGCNFRCVYCHQPHVPLHMGEDVVEAIVNFIARKAQDINQLDISWFGGEPLINLSALRALAGRLQDICNEHDVAMSGFMSTNGMLLTDSVLAELFGLGITRYQISFDGAEDTHNKQRLAANGQPTFAPLWRNLCSYKKLTIPFEVIIRVHVRPDTVAAAAELLDQVRNEFGADGRYKVTVASIGHWGGPHDHMIPVFEDARAIIASFGSRISPANRYVEDNEVCTAANPGHLVIRPNGHVVKCAHSLDLPENQLGHLTREGEFVYRSGSIDSWIRGLISGDKRELACPRDGIERLHSPHDLVRRPRKVSPKTSASSPSR